MIQNKTASQNKAMTNYLKSIIVLGAIAFAPHTTFAQPELPPPPDKPTPRAVTDNSAKAQAQLAQAEDQLEAAQNALARVGSGPNTAWAFGGGNANSDSSLVIPRDGSDPKAFEECEEDLNVMARILSKSINHRGGKAQNAMGISVHTSLFGGNAVPRNLYIEGYGAIFFLDVNYPLVAPPAKKTEPESKEETSSEWETTRRELYHPDHADPWVQGFSLGAPSTIGGGPAEEYDADKVEELKKDLIGALKNAAHIRKLKSDETVTVVVNGRSRPEPKVVMKKSSGSAGTGGGGGGGFGGGGGGGGFGTSGSGSGSSSSSRYTDRLVSVISKHVPEGRSSKLILRAKKSDLEAAQKEKLSPDEFRKKVTIQVY
jgi:uncharacterized membrane protein YgcG